ncbi:hypothetical protein IJG29_02190 [Candidatus Saccharibacteria bacterium]|nr:hypothetical protein [Candidatus Saccharibacteria bacterium]
MKITKSQLFTFINFFIAVTGITAAIVAMTYGSRGARLDGTITAHWQQIFTFTVLSNIFLSIVAFISAILNIRGKLSGRAATWYLTAATAGAVTCITVLFFLAPMRAARGSNYFDMILEPMFFLHFLNPILAAVSFVFFLPTIPSARHARLIATIPILAYAVPYILFVVILQLVPDFYGVTFGGRYYLTPLVFLAFFLLAFAAASLLLFLHRKALNPKSI